MSSASCSFPVGSQSVLGTATNDHSLLVPPIPVGLPNVRQIVQCLTNGTSEMQDLILNECDIIFECRVCRSLYRSLINFLAHKRTYCTKKFCQNMTIINRNNDTDDETIIVIPEDCDDRPSEKKPKVTVTKTGKENNNSKVVFVPKRNLPVTAPPKGKSAATQGKPVQKTNCLQTVIGPTEEEFPKADKPRLYENMRTYERKNRTSISSSSPGNTPNSSPVRGDKVESTAFPKQQQSNSIPEFLSPSTSESSAMQGIKRLISAPQKYSTVLNDAVENLHQRKSKKKNIVIQLRPIESNSNAVFQTTIDPPQLGAKNHDNLTQITEDSASVIKSNVLTCGECGNKYQNRKSLRQHMKNSHAPGQLSYPCLLCKEVFCQEWLIRRHLIRAHRCTTEQADRKKEIIKKKAMKIFRERSHIGNARPKSNSGKILTAVNGKKPTTQSVKAMQSSSVSNIRQAETSPKVLYKCSYCSKLFQSSVAMSNHVRSHKALFQPTPPAKTSVMLSVKTEPKDSKVKKEVKKPMVGKVLTKKVKPVSSSGKPSIVKKEETTKTSHPAIRIVKRDPKSVRRKLLSLMDSDDKRCLLCQKTFHNATNVRYHLLLHLEWHRYRCKLCDFGAATASSIKRHLYRKHEVRFKSNPDGHRRLIITSAETKEAWLKKHNYFSLNSLKLSRPNPTTKAKRPSRPHIPIDHKKMINEIKGNTLRVQIAKLTPAQAASTSTAASTGTASKPSTGNSQLQTLETRHTKYVKPNYVEQMLKKREAPPPTVEPQHVVKTEPVETTPVL